MPKSIEVLPERLTRRGSLVVPPLPLYQYSKPFETEATERGQDELKQVLRHMIIIREFENMLHALRSRGEHAGIKCMYRGPAHLSVGQEPAAVGLALALNPEDHIYGSHRSHGEFLAKGLAAIANLSDNSLGDIMAAHAGGKLLKILESNGRASGENLPEDFLLFGFLTEILMRPCGFNAGMGGSMHAFFPPFGCYPNNAIVGGSAGIAAGAALYKRQHRQSISVSVTGDGSTGCGATWEAMNFASMGQIKSLWHDQDDLGLPVLFAYMNNFYAMGGQTSGETMGWDRLSRIGLAINPQCMHAETVDGTNPLAVADAVARKRRTLIDGNGPALLDIECYRYSGHSTSDANAYRSREEISAWNEHDGITRFAAQLVAGAVMTEAEVESLQHTVEKQLTDLLSLAADPSKTEIVNINEQPAKIGHLMFNHTKIDIASLKDDSDIEREFEFSVCSRIRQNKKKSRYGLDAEGKSLSPMRAISLRDALFESILFHLIRDDRLIAYGEECREWGGAFGVYRGLSDLFPHHRLFNSPISEATIVSSAVGYAIEGGRALVELMYADFIGRAGDEIFNQLSKWQAMSGAELSIPVVVRCSVGSKYGAQHSQDWTSLITHIPGLKVIYPATPYDAKGLMAAALSVNDPVVFFESQRLYDVTEHFSDQGVPEDYYEIAIGEPDIKRTGDDLTILSIGPCLYTALEAADLLKEHYALNTEVIDARSLVPFNYSLLLKSVKKTGRLMIVSEACERGAFSQTIANNVSRFAFTHLKAAPLVVGSPNWVIPGAEMESTYFVSSNDIIDSAMQTFYPEITHGPLGIRSWDPQSLAEQGL